MTNLWVLVAAGAALLVLAYLIGVSRAPKRSTKAASTQVKSQAPTVGSPVTRQAERLPAARQIGDWQVMEGDAAMRAAVSKRIVGADEKFAAIAISPRTASAPAGSRLIGAIRCHGCGRSMPFEEEITIGGGLSSDHIDCECGSVVTLMMTGDAATAFFVVQPFTSIRGQALRPIAMSVDKIWDPREDAKGPPAGNTVTLKGHSTSAFRMAFSSDGARLASGDYEGVVIIWDVAKGKAVHKWSAHAAAVDCIAWSRDGSRVMTACDDARQVRMWDTDTGENLWTADVGGPVTSIAFLLNGNHVASSGSTVNINGKDYDERRIRVWNVETGKPVREIPGHTGAIYLATPVAAETILSGSSDGTTRLWQLADGSELKRCQANGEITGVAQSPNGELAAFSTFRPAVVTIWNLESGKPIQTLSGHRDGLRSVAFLPSGTGVVTSSWDSTVRVWDVGTGKEQACLTGVKSGFALSADGQRVAISLPGGAIEVRELALG